MGALEVWLGDTQAHVTTSDGHTLTVVPVRITDCFIAGAIPLPVLEEMAKLEAEALGTPDGLERPSSNGTRTPEQRLADLTQAQNMEDIYVRLAITEFDGEPCEMTSEAVRRLGAIDPEAYREVLGIAARTITAPGE